MAPASTGSDSSSRKVVTRIDHTNRGIRCSVMPGARMLKIVVMKLMAPRIEDAPARWRLRIAMSTAIPGWPDVASGAYTVQPAPTPPSTKADPTSRIAAGTSSQKLMLFMRGNAMSGAPIISGTNQFPKPPIIAGMMKKKTMIRPCAVVHTLNAWGSSATS